MVSTSIHVKIAVDYSAVVASDAATFLQSSFLLLGGTCFGQAAGVVYMWSTRRAPQSCAMCATSAQGCDEEPHALKNGTRAACARRPRHRSGGVGGGRGIFVRLVTLVASRWLTLSSFLSKTDVAQVFRSFHQ